MPIFDPNKIWTGNVIDYPVTWGNQAPEAGEPLERHPGDTPGPEDPQE